MAKKSEDVNLAFVEPNSNAKIEGIITSLSPMKVGKSCSYYDGEIADDHSSMRFCGFNSTARRKLEDCNENGEAVVFNGCEVKKSRQRDGLEIIVKKGTEISKSHRSFQITKDSKAVMPLEKVLELPQYQRVAIKAKIMHVDSIFELRSGEKVQEVILADATGHAKLTIWGEHLGKVKEGCSFEMKGLMVRDYHGCRCLSTSKEGCSIKEIDDIGKLSTNADDKMQLEIKLIKDVRVFAVDKFESYSSCVKCNGKVTMIDEDDIGECPKCGTMQKIEECKQTLIAQLRTKAENGDRFCLSAFDVVLLKIAEEPANNISKKALIKADPFNMKFSDGVIYYVERD